MTPSTACASGCGRPAPGATLCPACTGSLRATLQLAASIAGDLDDAIARQMRHGGSGRRTGTEPPLPIDLRASDAASELRLALAEAIHVMLPRRAWSATDHTMAGMARWLLMHLPELVRHDRAGDVHARVHDAVARCVRVLDAPPEHHPAGDCECGRPLLADAHADEARCACGIVTAGIQERRRARADAADVLGSADAISAALALLGITVSGGTIRQLVTRGRLARRPDGQLAMSEVLAWVAQRDERKVGR
jgi:hypothetical protein